MRPSQPLPHACGTSQPRSQPRPRPPQRSNSSRQSSVSLQIHNPRLRHYPVPLMIISSCALYTLLNTSSRILVPLLS